MDGFCLKRDEGETVGTYKIYLEITDDKVKDNYDIETNPDVLTINPLKVVIRPTSGQQKLYGEKDPITQEKTYEYTVHIPDESILDFRDDFCAEGETPSDTARRELGDKILNRGSGELPGTYAYELADGINANYKPIITENASVFEIKLLEISAPESITSRTDRFTVGTNLKNNKRNNEATKLKIVVAKGNWATTRDGIGFSTNINDYLKNIIDFKKESFTVQLKEAQYTKEKQSWPGYLPAGTTVTVSVVAGNGTVVSNSVNIKVIKTDASLGDWGAFEGPGADGRRFVKGDAKGGTGISVTMNSKSKLAELVKVDYNKDASVYKGLKDKTAYTLTPKSVNNGTTHTTQTVTASIVDTLNLQGVMEAKAEFYVDDQAFPVSSVEFKNRDKEIKITLPEYGTIESVTIPGGEVKIEGAKEKQFTLPVTWSGKDLISSGSSISVTYSDEAGNKGQGTGNVGRSSVSTPIRFKIRPELNGAGYLNGRSTTLLISGTACACEQIRVSVADATQMTYATQKETWSDDTGSWEIAVPMSSLPEGQDFSISAEYVDVSGEGYSITAKYDEFCADATVVSPIFEAMSYLSGMVEPQTTVALVVNGDTQSYYEIDVDRFGHFVMDDVPMMFAGESFDIYVTDIAGNQSIRHYEIEEPDDPYEVKSVVNPLGKFFYSAEANGSEAYVATPVSAADFEEYLTAKAEEDTDDTKETKKIKDTVEIPLLMGMSYEVGTLTLHKTENGFTVSTEIKVSDDIDTEDYTVENDKLYVYTSRPTLNDIKNCTGKEYTYGEEIPFGENETVWIVDNKDMTILADSMADLTTYDYAKRKEYEAYQER